MVAPISFPPRIPFNAQDPLAILVGDILIGGQELGGVEHYSQVIAVRDSSDRYALCQTRDSALEKWSQSEGVFTKTDILQAMQDLQRSLLRQNHELYIPTKENLSGLSNPGLAERLAQQKTEPVRILPYFINGSVLTSNRVSQHFLRFQAFATALSDDCTDYIVQGETFSLIAGCRQRTSQPQTFDPCPLAEAVERIVQLQHEKMQSSRRPAINWQELESANLDPNGVFRIAARHEIRLDPRPQASSPQRTPPRP